MQDSIRSCLVQEGQVGFTHGPALVSAAWKAVLRLKRL